MKTSIRPARSRHGVGLPAAIAAALLVTAPATAQRNSLFGARRQPAPVPTTQPAGSALPGLPLDAGVGIRETVLAAQPETKKNAVLLHTSPFAVAQPDPEKIKVHDQITIIIRESKTATSDSKLEHKKDWKHEWELSKWLRFSDKHGIVPALFSQGNPAVALDYQNDYKGDGKYDRTDELTTRIQATVIDVKPNGTLVLQATKAIDIDDEGYAITLTGTCRGVDVTPTNTILSTQIADLRINVEHSGAVRDAARRGWLQRGLDFLRPF